MSAPRPILITGAGSGIGRATALALAATNPVAVSDLDLDAAEVVATEVEAAGGEAVAVGLDVTATASVEAGVERAATRLGGIGGLVNNAGWSVHAPLLEQDDAHMLRNVEVNLLGPLRVIRAALPALREWGSGRVVNVASDAARGGASNTAAYSGAKGGVIALTRSLALELAKDAITVNTVSPGVIDTPMLASSMAPEDPIRERLVKRIPLRRLGRPEEVAACIAFFCSEGASYTTGQLLSCNGGVVVA